MGHDLEHPGTTESPDWGSLYRARGVEVVAHRPVFTGDIFEKIPSHGLGEARSKTVMIAHHPCALRSNGIDLHSRVAVHEIRTHPLIAAGAWVGHLNKMPLPDLDPTVTSGKRHRAAIFDAPGLVDSADLDPAKRIACLSPAGVNLLLQRWVHFTSRVVVPTFSFQEMVEAAYEEADLIEEWCDQRTGQGLDIHSATVEAVTWLRQDAGGGVSRQDLLRSPQQRSPVRRHLRDALRKL